MRRPKGNPHYFLAQFLPLAALVLIAAAFLYQSRVDGELRRLQLEQRERVALGVASLANDMDAPLRHLSILTGEAPIARTINDPSPANIAVMQDNFSTLMLRNPSYDQVRWIDENGMEKVRVNMTSTGPVAGPRLMPSEAMPVARARRSGGYVRNRMDWPTGTIRPPPMP